jgi:hypothetical protein
MISASVFDPLSRLDLGSRDGHLGGLAPQAQHVSLDCQGHQDHLVRDHTVAADIDPKPILKTGRVPGFLLLPANSSDQNLRSIRVTAAHLRRIGAGTFDQLNEAIGQICELFTPEEC